MFARFARIPASPENLARIFARILPIVARILPEYCPKFARILPELGALANFEGGIVPPAPPPPRSHTHMHEKDI